MPRKKKYAEAVLDIKKGDPINLDAIYVYQGLGESKKGQWYEHVNGDEQSDDLIATRDIKITVTVTE